jgi:hypothetical protein
MRTRIARSGLAAILLAAIEPALAGTISIGWDPVPTATGYRVYYGTASRAYTGVLDVGSRTEATLENLADCRTWYVAVKAYNAAGESASFSDEVSGWPRPAITGANPSAAKQGDQVTVDILGTNFETGATVEIDNPHVSLRSVRTLACDRIQLVMTIEPTAEGVRPAAIGSFSLTVVQPDNVFGTRSNAFEVLVNPARFDINRSDEATNGRLDGKDTVWMARLFGGQEGGPLYDPDGDFNGDGWVDGDDLAYVASNLGGCWNGTAWAAAACPALAH